ncbi:MAG TPA: ABC transporter permease [Blastocatellia bacterium]|nr:ABC transporter permease [Blastocatellia bacterium]
MHTLWQDLRYTVRMMAGNRGFTAVAVLALALGIGANSVIFSVVNAVLLRSLPYPEPDRIVMVFESDLKKQSQEAIAGANFLDWREQNQVFENLAAYRQDTFSLTGTDRPERAWGVVTTASLFPVLGVKPILGRVFQAEDENRGSGRVAVISQGLWERRFASDPNIVGQKLTANGEPLTIIGVMPADFRFPAETDLWIPPRQYVPEHVLRPTVNMATNRDSHYLDAIASLKPGVTLDQARADMNAVAHHIEEQNPEAVDRGVSLVTLREYQVGNMRPTLLILFGAVGFVLLIACANVANLLLARAATRHKEIAIRTALGASRLRLLRQLLTESLALSVAGGGLGLLLAAWGIGPLISLMPASISGAKNIRIDGMVLFFTLGVSILTGLVFGLVPALQATKSDLNESLKEGGRGGTAGAHRSRVRSLLVVSEIALSLVLLIGAGLMIKSFIRLEQVNPGFEARNVLTMRLSLPAAQYPDGRRRGAFFQQVVERIGAVPGAQSAAAISRLPLSPGNSSRSFEIEGRANAGSDDGPSADYRVISSDYFKALSIPLLKGREFTEQDNSDSPPTTIINEAAARRFWPDEDPLGKRLRIESDQPWIEIVGVVGNVKHLGLDSQARAELYLSFLKDPWPFMTVVVRGASNPKSLAEAMRAEVWAIDKDLPVPDIKTMDELVSGSVARRRFNMLLLGIFASVALVLAAVGIYGVMSYSVTQRTHEIGIRMALGARQSDVLKLVIRQGATLAAVGVGIGLVGASALTRVLASLLFEVGTTDPATFVSLSLLLTAVALGACFVPARRAAKVDPMVALRYE